LHFKTDIIGVVILRQVNQPRCLTKDFHAVKVQFFNPQTPRTKARTTNSEIGRQLRQVRQKLFDQLNTFLNGPWFIEVVSVTLAVKILSWGCPK